LLINIGISKGVLNAKNVRFITALYREKRLIMHFYHLYKNNYTFKIEDLINGSEKC